MTHVLTDGILYNNGGDVALTNPISNTKVIIFLQPYRYKEYKSNYFQRSINTTENDAITKKKKKTSTFLAKGS